MRYTRFEFKDHDNNGLKKFFLRFFVLVPVVGLAAGFIITRFVIIPYLFRMEKTSNHDAVHTISYIYSDIRTKKYHMIQTGVFTDMNNAEALADRLRASNLPAYIKPEKEYIRVLSYGSNSGDFMEEKMKDLKALEFDCIDKEVSIGVYPVPDTPRNNQWFIIAGRILNSISDGIDKYCSLLSKYESGHIDDNILKNNYLTIFQDISREISLLKSMGDDDTRVLNGVSSHFKAFDMLMEETPAGISDHHERLIQAIYIFKETVEYINEMIKL